MDNQIKHKWNTWLMDLSPISMIYIARIWNHIKDTNMYTRCTTFTHSECDEENSFHVFLSQKKTKNETFILF